MLYLFDHPHGMHAIGLLPLTKRVLFVVTNDSVNRLRSARVDGQLKKVDWGFECSPTNVEELLDEAIAAGSWTVDFLNRIFPGMDLDEDQVYHGENLGLYLIVKGGCLIDYISSDGLNTWGKELHELNSGLVNGWLAEGLVLHGDHHKAINYVNVQSNAWSVLPASMNNEFIPAYSRKDGTIDFFMILALEEKHPITEEDFQLRIGTKRAARSEKDGDLTVYDYEGRQFYFAESTLQLVR